MRVSIILIGLGLMLGVSTSIWALDPADKCEAAKVKEAAKLHFCRMKVESKAIKKGTLPDFSKCNSKYTTKWPLIETKAAGACPTDGDEATIQSQVTTDTDAIVTSLAGIRFIDNGDGTITDTQTKLMWEKKVGGSGCLHCVDDPHSFANAMSEWITEVNGLTDDISAQSGLGGHSDWRIPTIVELQTILLEPFPCSTNPCIDSIFGPTASNWYWSSTTSGNLPSTAWNVLFQDGLVNNRDKADTIPVRAVLGGP